MDAGLKLLRLAGGKTEATGQAEMRSDRVLRKRKLVKEEGKYLLFDETRMTSILNMQKEYEFMDTYLHI